jgi:hypothetical protein
MERTRVWRGHVRSDSRDQHEQFVRWLNTDEAQLQYAKFLLNGYTLSQQGDDLTIALTAEEPPAIIRFLRNSRMWPEFWEYDPGDGEPEVPEEFIRVRWQRP